MDNRERCGYRNEDLLSEMKGAFQLALRESNHPYLARTGFQGDVVAPLVSKAHPNDSDPEDISPEKS